MCCFMLGSLAANPVYLLARAGSCHGVGFLQFLKCRSSLFSSASWLNSSRALAS